MRFSLKFAKTKKRLKDIKKGKLCWYWLMIPASFAFYFEREEGENCVMDENTSSSCSVNDVFPIFFPK